ncbi:MAG: hypothetical protein RTU92_02355 [Candidatus Thorarchaeota archaeon]
MDFSALRSDFESQPWDETKSVSQSLSRVNLAPLKGVLDSDPVRSNVLRLLIEDGGWVTTGDLLRVARKVRRIVGAVTIGTILNGLNELVSSRMILSRTSLASGLDWAEWRINPDLIDPTRKLLRMISRPRLASQEPKPASTVQTSLLGEDVLSNE